MQEMQAAQHAKEKEAASLELEREKRWLVKQQRQLAERDSARETQSTRLGSRVQAQDTRYARGGGGGICVCACTRACVCLRAYERVVCARLGRRGVDSSRASSACSCRFHVSA